MQTKRSFITLLFILLLGMLTAGIASAAPNSVNYQGILNDSAGSPVPDQSFNMIFRIYDAATGGTILYEESQSVATVNGIYDVLLGTGTVAVGAFNPTLFSANRWLEVTVNGETLTPRQQVTSVAFSLQAEEAVHAAAAGNADTVDGLHAAALDQSGHAADTANPHHVTAAQAGTLSKVEIDTLLTKHTNDPAAHHAKTTTFPELTGQIADAQIPATIARDTELTWGNLAGKPAGFADGIDNDSGGDITGITAGLGLNGGGTTGNATLNVNVPLTLNGSQPSGGVLSGTNSNITGYGVHGSATATGTAVNYGGYFESDGDFGSGIYGYTPSTGTSASGVFGKAIGGYGIKGLSQSGTGGYFNSITGNGLIVEGGNVGIGTTTPAEKLEVNGNLKVNGNISWPAKTGYLAIPPAAFISDAGNKPYTNAGSWIAINDIYPGKFNAPVYLPQGAIVTKVSTYWTDNATGNASFAFRRDYWGTEAQMVSGITNWKDINPRSVSLTLISNSVIDNSTYSYHFNIQLPASETAAHDVVFYGARIEYTYTGN